MKKTLFLTQGAIIGAMYFALTMFVAPISYGPIQFRISEALMLLPVFTPAAIPGLCIGCFLANLLNPTNLGVIDIVGGAMATLIAAILTRKIATMKHQKLGDLTIKNKITWLLPIPSILINGLIVGGYLLFILPGIETITFQLVLLNMLSIALCEAVVVYVLGIPLFLLLKRSNVALRFFYGDTNKINEQKK